MIALAFLPLLGKLLLGKVVETVIEGKSEPIKERVTKGLIRSKTAGAATAMGGIKAAIFTLPVDADVKLYALMAISVIEWAVSMYLRVKTKEPV